MAQNNNPLVSIGITTYSRPYLLEKTLDCAVNQSHKNIEIIVSEDRTPCQETNVIIKKYHCRDSRIKYFRQIENIGAAKNMRFVLEKATGDFFTWFDDDDFRDSKWIECLLKKIRNYDTVISLGKVVSVDIDGNIIRKYRSQEFEGSKLLRTCKYFLSEESSGKVLPICGLFKTSFLKSMKQLDEYDQKHFGVDFLFVLQCLQHGNIAVDESVTMYKLFEKGKYPPNKTITKWIFSFARRLQYLYSCVKIARGGDIKIALFIFLPVKLVFLAINKLHKKY